MNRENLKPVNDEDLVLLYYGEHEDLTLAATVAGSEELSERFANISAELGGLDSYQPPQPGIDYGQRLWRTIAPELDTAPEQKPVHVPPGWLAGWFSPGFSPAALGVLFVAVVIAFWVGKNRSAVEPGYAPAIALETAPGLNTDRLLRTSVAEHLSEVDLVMTEFANSSDSSARQAEWATDMLVRNRLYRQSAAVHGDARLAGFLSELEPVLIEMAYQAHEGNLTSRKRMQDEIRTKLLFRVRFMNQRLNSNQISI